MQSYTAIVERDHDTQLYVGYIPGIPGAHSQAETLDELVENMREVLAMLFEDGEVEPNADFIGTQVIMVNGHGQKAPRSKAY